MKNLRMFLIAVLVVSMSFIVGCKKTNENEGKKDDAAATTTEQQTTEDKSNENSEAEKNDEASVQMWEGDWNSIDGYYDEPEVKEAIEKAAKEKNQTSEEYLKDLDKTVGTIYKSMHVDKDGITLYDGKIGEGKEMAKVNCTFKEKIEVPHGNKTLNWFVFETDSKDVPKYIALMQVHGEEHLAHFHARFTDDLKEVSDEENGWFPTFVRTSSDIEDIAEELTE